MKPNLGARFVSILIAIWVRWLYLRLWFRLNNYRRNQLALARRYQLDGLTPEKYNDATRERIVQLAETSAEEKQFAWTSGTTRAPKQIFYPARRAKRVQRTLVEQVLLAYDYARVTRPAFYLLTSMVPDKSWSSLFVRKPFPALVNRLLLPGSIAFVPRAAELVERTSQSAVHAALWLIAEPSFIVTANPSSLYVVLEQVKQEWGRMREQIKSILADEGIQKLQQNVTRMNHERQTKIAQLLDSAEPPAVRDLLPQLQVVYCWDGGYVTPFADNLKKQFVGHAVKFLPMFSVSTETVSYQMYPRVSLRGGLPIYPGNCYEFILPDSEPTAQNVLKPWELQVGSSYVLLVSDEFGLKRYNTEDLFECRGMERNTPVIHFSGRVGLRYSFTGEKITAEQLLDLYESLRQDFGLAGAIFTCFPKVNAGSLPGYVFVHCAAQDEQLPPGLTAAEFDRRLAEINIEYAAKRKSGRLAAPLLTQYSFGRVANTIRNSNPRYQGSNPAQFKLLPMYQVMWEDLPITP